MNRFFGRAESFFGRLENLVQDMDEGETSTEY